jgi:hypothetical protein
MASYVEQEFDKNHRQLYVEYECGEYGATHRHLIDRHENLPGEHLEKLSYAIKWLRRWRQDVVAECEKKNVGSRIQIQYTIHVMRDFLILHFTFYKASKQYILARH